MSHSKYAILGLLTFGPMTGYDLRKVITVSLAHFWHESYGNLYPRLAKLQAEGLIRVRAERRQGRVAKVYTIAAQGRTALRAWLARPAEAEQVRSEMLLKVFLGAQLPPAHTERQILAHRTRQQAYLNALAETERQVRADAPNDRNLPYWLMTIRRGALHAEARLRWCDECLTTLRAMRRPARGSAPAKKGRRP